ncbi:tyrosinase central domain protein [Penicillium herquei]|nr:tyrosinase central domain protein [Penicillium herquei]
MSPPERVAYSDAVTCLQNLPSQLDNTQYPGAKNRYADFVATHINYTFIIHLDAIFLPWHRGNVWLYESALRDECGYKGAQSYWDWPAYVKDGLENSTIFDGPFSNYTTTFPYFANDIILDNIENNGSGTIPSWSFDYTPNCFQRAMDDDSLRLNNNYSDIEQLLSQPTIEDFQNILSTPEGDAHYGPHGGGHVAMGGDGADLFTSPTDPVFFLHHAQVDRMWWTWQSRDLENRRYALSGTQTLENVPASPELTLEDQITWGPLGRNYTTKSLMAANDGPFCYRYE